MHAASPHQDFVLLLREKKYAILYPITEEHFVDTKEGLSFARVSRTNVESKSSFFTTAKGMQRVQKSAVDFPFDDVTDVFQFQLGNGHL
jgi:hypothetical protein